MCSSCTCLVCTQFSHFAARSFSSELNLPACLVTCCHSRHCPNLTNWPCIHYIKHTENKHNTPNDVTNNCFSFWSDTTAEEVLSSFTFDFFFYSSWLIFCSKLALRFGFWLKRKLWQYSRLRWRVGSFKMKHEISDYRIDMTSLKSQTNVFIIHYPLFIIHWVLTQS